MKLSLGELMDFNLIDTHAHLNFPDYKKDLDQVIKRSLENVVGKIICVSSNLADSFKAIEIAKKYPHIIYAAVGIHPHQTDPENKDSLKEQIKKLKTLVKKEKVVAIGECGLDFSQADPELEKNRTSKDQEDLFRWQIEMALEFNLPVLVHSRKAFPQVMTLLREYFQSSDGHLRGIFHCYSAGKKEIKQVEEIGFFFGLDGNLTYDLGLQNVAKEIPLEKIVLETDCPFLSPEPYRGLRNETGNVKINAEFLSKLKSISLDKVAQETTQNAQKLFKI